MSFQLSDIIHIAKDDLKLVCRKPLDEAFLELLIDQVRSGVVVKVVTTEAQRGFFTENPFLLNKSITFVNEGGRLYLSEEALQDQAIIDFSEWYTFEETLKREAPERLDLQLQHFTQLISGASAFLEETDEVILDVKASSQHIKKGGEVTIEWTTSKANHVMLTGCGEVATQGKQVFRPAEDTIFKMSASDEMQTKREAIYVKVGGEVKVSYELAFLNKHSSEFTKLNVTTGPTHVYGLAQGNKVRLSWQSINCETVTVSPFDLNTKEGSYEFTSEENLEIKLEGMRGDEVYTQSIKLLVFPIAIHTQHLAEVLPAIVTNAAATITSSLVGKVAAYKKSGDRLLGQLRLQEMERFYELLEKIPFSEAETGPDVTFTQLEPLHKLKKKYTRKELSQMLDSIRKYDDTGS